MLPCRQHQHECTADWIWTPGQSRVRNAFHTTRESSISPAVSSAGWGWDCFSSTLSATCREPWPCECLPRSVGRRFWPWPIEHRISASASLPSAHDSISAAQRSTASYCRLFARCSHVVGHRPELIARPKLPAHQPDLGTPALSRSGKRQMPTRRGRSQVHSPMRDSEIVGAFHKLPGAPAGTRAALNDS